MSISWIASFKARAGALRHVALSSVVLGVLASGCQSTLESGLPEAQANEIVVALDRHGVHAVKEADRSSGNTDTFSVTVASDDVATALTILDAEHLPRHETTGLSEVFNGASLVPTHTEESARLRAALAGELAQTIQSIDGVLTARVHIALADSETRLLDQPTAGPRASVLIRHRGQEPPYDAEAITRLVAGAVSGMDPNDVAIVGVPSEGAPANPARLVSIGPIAVARSSAPGLKLTLGVLLGTNLVLAILLAITIKRRPRLASDPKV
jgi:type III secretion protein J